MRSPVTPPPPASRAPRTTRPIPICAPPALYSLPLMACRHHVSRWGHRIVPRPRYLSSQTIPVLSASFPTLVSSPPVQVIDARARAAELQFPAYFICLERLERRGRLPVFEELTEERAILVSSAHSHTAAGSGNSLDNSGARTSATSRFAAGYAINMNELNIFTANKPTVFVSHRAHPSPPTSSLH